MLLFVSLQISEWFSSRWDCSSVYVCTIELIKEVDGVGKNVIMAHYNYSKAIKDGEQNQWFKVSTLSLYSL